MIHAVYLINCASKEREIRRKSLASLEHALRIGDGIGAAGVVLHAGARKGEPYGPSVRRAGKAIREALEGSERSPLLLENTAGTQGPLGRNFDELAELIDAAGGGKRLGACLDCCHLLASGFEIRSPEALAEVVDDFDAKSGASTGCAAYTSTTRRCRWDPTATGTPTSARGNRGPPAFAPSSPSPGSRSCPR